MPGQFPPDPNPLDRREISEGAAARLLARASELQAAGERSFTVAQLRAAAEEAGIPAQAFDAALAEQQHGPGAATALSARGVTRRLTWTWILAGAATLIAIGGLAALRQPASVVEEAIVLRCLAPGEAAELVRPLLRDRSSTVTHSAERAPRVLTIRATPDVIDQAKEVLAEHERDGSSSCAVTVATP